MESRIDFSDNQSQNEIFKNGTLAIHLTMDARELTSLENCGRDWEESQSSERIDSLFAIKPKPQSR